MLFSFALTLRVYSQPVSWFGGAGAGITLLHANRFSGKIISNSGQMSVVLAGIDIPLHEKLRPMVRATLTGYKAYFHTVKVDERLLSQSYSLYLNSITPELSFLYHVLNKKLKAYLGVGVNINACWSPHYNYKAMNTRTGFVYWDTDGNIPLEPCWPSFSVKTGLKFGNWELGVTGYIRGIIAWDHYDTLNGDIYFISLGYHFGK